MPDIILQKPGKLTAEEFETMKLHTVRGGEIIRDGSGQDFEPMLVEVFLDIRDKVEAIHNEVAAE